MLWLWGKYWRKCETLRNWRKGTTRNGACGLIWFNAEHLTKSRQVKDWQLHFNMTCLVVHGRSWLVDCFVWFIPLTSETIVTNSEIHMWTPVWWYRARQTVSNLMLKQVCDALWCLGLRVRYNGEGWSLRYWQLSSWIESCFECFLAIMNTELGISSICLSSWGVERVPAFCTHRPSLLPIERLGKLSLISNFAVTGSWIMTFKGRRSRNKVAVGEPSAGSFIF